MSGKDALRHIRDTEECSLSKARNQLQAAISNRAVTARLPDPKDPSQMAIFPPWADKGPFGPGGTPGVFGGNRQFPSLKMWATARIRANGTAQFFGPASLWYRFDVGRAGVLQIWPATVELPDTSRRRAGRPPKLRQAAEDWLKRNYPAGVPEDVTLTVLSSELKAADILVSERTLGRLLTGLPGRPAKSRKT
jgi:hypothetical protein